MSTDSNTVPQFATDIIEQLGGRGIFRMAFSRCAYDASKCEITFHVHPDLRSSTREHITHVRVIVEPSDTYRVVMIAQRGRKVVEVDNADGLYCDQIQDLVERHTGLVLSFRRPVVRVA